MKKADMSLANLFLLFKEELGLGLFGLSCGLQLQIVEEKKESKVIKEIFQKPVWIEL